MDPVGIIVWLVLGAIAGFIAGKIMNTGGSLVTNIIVGIIGAFIGGIIFSALGIGGGGLIGSIITAVVGAVVLLFVLGLVQKGKNNVTS